MANSIDELIKLQSEKIMQDKIMFLARKRSHKLLGQVEKDFNAGKYDKMILKKVMDEFTYDLKEYDFTDLIGSKYADKFWDKIGKKFISKIKVV